MRPSVASVVGEPLINWRLVPAEVKVRLRTSWFSSHGSRPFSSRKLFSGARSFFTSNTASTEQLSSPLRMSVRSARSPRTRLSAPRMMDLPAPVSPVMALQPGWSSSVRSLTRARFLMRSVVSIFRWRQICGLAADCAKKNSPATRSCAAARRAGQRVESKKRTIMDMFKPRMGMSKPASRASLWRPPESL